MDIETELKQLFVVQDLLIDVLIERAALYKEIEKGMGASDSTLSVDYRAICSTNFLFGGSSGGSG